MGKKRISEDAKLQAVMDLLSGESSHAEICTRYGISQTYLYKLRDKALEGIKAAVSDGRKRACFVPDVGIGHIHPLRGGLASVQSLPGRGIACGSGQCPDGPIPQRCAGPGLDASLG